MPTDPFTGEGDNNPQDFNNQFDPNKDYFSELVGEDKKFKTPAELAKAKAESDRFIEQLKSENSGLRNELKTRTTIEDFMKTIKESRQAEQPVNNQTQQQEDNSGTPIKPEDIEALVARTLDSRTQAQKEQENYQKVVDQVNKVYGNDAAAVVQRKAAELGMDVKTLQSMAKANPNAFLKLVDADKTPVNEGDFFSAPPRSSTQVTDTRSSDEGGPKNFAYYERIREKDPNKYWSPSVQNAMHKDALRLEEKFYS